MGKPAMFEPYPAAPDIDVLPSYVPIPGYGILPINAFVLKAAEPVLVDTGLTLLNEEFLPQLSSVIDPQDLRWLWLTHVDPDHTGSLHRLVEEVPHLRVITTFLALGKLMLFRPLPPERVYLLNPGQSLAVGGRTLTAVRPPPSAASIGPASKRCSGHWPPRRSAKAERPSGPSFPVRADRQTPGPQDPRTEFALPGCLVPCATL